MVDDISRQWNRRIKCYLSFPCEQRRVSIGVHIIFFVPIGWPTQPKKVGPPINVKIQIVCKVAFMVFKRNILEPRFQHRNWQNNLILWG